MSSETTTDTPARSSPLLFIAIVVVALVACGILVAGFWGDKDDTVEFTPRQADISDLETGPGSPIPD